MLRRVAASAFLFALILSPVHATPVVVLHDAELVCDETLYRGTSGAVYVATYGALGLDERQPLAGSRVTVRLESIPGAAGAVPARDDDEDGDDWDEDDWDADEDDDDEADDAGEAAGDGMEIHPGAGNEWPSWNTWHDDEAATRARPRAKRRAARKPGAAARAEPVRRYTIGTATTGRDGRAVISLALPRDLPTGGYTLVVDTRSQHGARTLRHAVTVADPVLLHVRTDREVYRPGQTLRWRVTALNVADAHPIADAPVAVYIRDAGDTAIWHGTVTTDRAGMASGEVPLADDLAMGGYSIEARSGPAEQSEYVRIRGYQLPAFVVAIEPEPGKYRAGDTVTGRVVARYPHGEPVSGRVEIGADVIATARGDRRMTHERARIFAGRLDRFGQAAFSWKIPARATRASIDARVADGARRRHEAAAELPFAPNALEIAVVPERAKLAPGRMQWMTVITTDGAGNLAPSRLVVRAGKMRARYESPGAVRVPIMTPSSRSGPDGYARLIEVIVAADADGRSAHTKLSIPLASGPERWLRPREAVVDAGEEIAIAGRWLQFGLASSGESRASGPAIPLVVTLLRRGVPIAATFASADPRDGSFAAALTPPPGVFGLVTARVTEIVMDDGGGLSDESRQASVYIRPAPLAVSIATERTRYRPGERAALTVDVRDAAGRPAAGVGLAASVVDERVLQLGEPGPDLARVLRALDVSGSRTAGLVFADLLAREQTAEVRAAMRAIVEALPLETIAPGVQVSSAQRRKAEIARLERARRAVVMTLVDDPAPIGRKLADGGWEFNRPLDHVLIRARWKPAARLTPWKRATDWEYARRLVPDLTFDDLAPRIAAGRLHALARALRRYPRQLNKPDALANLAARGRLARHLLTDPWGSAVRLEHAPHPLMSGDPAATKVWIVRSPGPDQTFGTGDDVTAVDVLGEVVSRWGYGTGSGYGTLGAGRAGSAPSVRIGSAGRQSDDMTLRRRFDQTVLWAVGIRTDARGQASLEVPLADSITGWKVAVEALGPRGGVGAATSRLETALPVFADATVPEHLTVGDRYAIPIVLANHDQTPRTLAVDVRVADALERVASERAAPARVTLPAGTTRAVAVDVRARRVGTGVVEVRIADEAGRALDGVRRELEVRAPGHIVRISDTGSQAAGGLSYAFDLPAGRAAGTTRGELRLFRGVVDVALDGLEGMLSEPHGCFEQTSSSTYPNLLVLALLGDGAEHAAVRERARELVSKGYQRLIGYEVDGGGFSWFGDAPANQVLTAYGLMEFSDMAAVYPVDPELIARTQAWLLGVQQADGSWQRDESWLHDWSAVQGAVSTTAYVAWALAESGYRGPALRRAFTYLRRHADVATGDSYLLALWAAAEARGGVRSSFALPALQRRASRERDALSVSAGGKTLFYASGNAADAQVTALSALAFARSGSIRDAAAAVRWLWGAREGTSGGWGSTQGTVLALRAAAAMKPGKPVTGIARVAIDGAVVGSISLSGELSRDPRAAAQGGLPALDLGARLERLAPGRHVVTVTGPAGVNGELRVRWRSDRVPVAEQHGIEVALAARSGQVAIGEPAGVTVRLANPGADAIAMPTVIAPVPPGFRADRKSLEALVRAGTIAKYSDLGSELHFYLTALAGRAAVSLSYSLEATAACDVAHGPVQAYAYYDSKVRGSSAPLRLSAGPRRSR